MNLLGKIGSLIYALVLLGCAAAAGFDTFGFAFAIGDGDGHVSLHAGILLIGTLIGGAGLVISAACSWARWPAANFVALMSVLMVFPAAVLYGWASFQAFWGNTQHGMHYASWLWASAVLPPFLDLVAARLSWVRFKELSSPTTSGQG